MSEVRLVVAILVPAIFTLILKDFFDLFMTNRYEGKVKQYTIWMLYFLLDTAISMNFKFVGVISMLYSFIILIIFCAVLYREDIKYITLRYGILFLTFFSLLRAFAGGVHLERFWSCTVLSGMVLSMVLLIAKYAVIPSIFSFALCVVMGILIFIVGPIDDKNRRISSDERCIFYRRLVYVLLFLVFTSALGVILDANRLAFIVSLTMGVFHIVQIIGKNKNMKLLEQ